MIILDMGAGDATENDIDYIKEVMRELPAGITVKFQLFREIEGLTPLDWQTFLHALTFGAERGIDVTASVFDTPSLTLLTKYVKVPFVKIACRPELYPLIDYVPEFMPILVSVDSQAQMFGVCQEHMDKSLSFMCCVPEYPAEAHQYEEFPEGMLRHGISDHTCGLDLIQTYRPRLWERHLDFKGPDQEHSISIEDVKWAKEYLDA